MSVPSGLARGLQRALGLESTQLDVPYRRAGPAWLLNPRRLEIVLTAAAYPGVHLRSASRLLLSPLPSLRFHVHRLEEQGLLRTWKSGSRVHLFVPGMYPLRVEPFLALWEDPFDRRVIRLIGEHPGLTREALGRQIVPNASVLERSLKRLLGFGVVRSTGSVQGRRFWVTASWKNFESLCQKGIPDRLQRFLSLLEAEGLRPVLEEMSPDRVQMSVDGPRFRIRFALPLNPLTRDPKE